MCIYVCGHVRSRVHAGIWPTSGRPRMPLQGISKKDPTSLEQSHDFIFLGLTHKHTFTRAAVLNVHPTKPSLCMHTEPGMFQMPTRQYSIQWDEQQWHFWAKKNNWGIREDMVKDGAWKYSPLCGRSHSLIESRSVSCAQFQRGSKGKAKPKHEEIWQ